jgi:hypothetical protein
MRENRPMPCDRRHFLATSGALAALACTGGTVWAATRTPLSGRAIQADLDLLLRAYTAVHPGLSRYLPAEGFAARIAEAKRWAEPGRSLPDVYVALSRLTAAVRCGHSHVNPFNQSRAAREGLLGGRDRMPFAFRWLDGRMIVTGSRGGEQLLPPGTEVRAVDGVAASELLRAMLPLARADGSNDAKRVAQLGVQAGDRYAAFDVFRPLLFPGGGAGTVRLSVAPPGGSERQLDLPALSETGIANQQRGGALEPGWTFALDPSGVGVLTMPDWVTYRSKWDWQGYLDGILDRLIDERARGLVIDLRGNEGGTECGWRILDRLIARDLALPRYIYRTRYRTLPAELTAPLETWDPSFRDWGAAASGPDEDGFYRLQRAADTAGVLTPRGRRYGGPVAVLVDASCSSATFQFALAVKQGRVATLIGEPTGGNRRGINGGAYFFIRLPETGLEVDLPIIGSFPPEPQPDAGVVPDVPVVLQMADIARGKDPAMAAALARMGASG